VLQRQLGDRVDEAFTTKAARADRQDDGRPVARADDDVLRLRRAVEEVPRLQLALLSFDEEQAGAGEHQEAFLRVLAVVEAHRLTGLEDVEVDPELPKRPLALEVAVEPERPGVVPPALARVDHEPAVAVGD
jgi:hypothetical protein